MEVAGKWRWLGFPWAGRHARRIFLALLVIVVVVVKDSDLLEVACRREQGDEHLRGVEGRCARSQLDGVDVEAREVSHEHLVAGLGMEVQQVLVNHFVGELELVWELHGQNEVGASKL